MQIMSNRLKYFLLVSLFLTILKTNVSAQNSKNVRNNFNKEELVAWCIVPFDIKKRGPEERCQMLTDLGITKLAYDWRESNIPTFDQEIDALKKHHIALQAFWLMSGTDVNNNPQIDAVFSLLKKRNIKTQIWYFFVQPQESANLNQGQKIAEAVKAVSVIAKRADSIGCKVGLYNHDGWFGEPENQLAILKELQKKNVGMVYNFNHAQNQIENFQKFFPLISPYLLAINLAGLKKGDQQIFPLSKNGAEKEMIKIILNSNYKGPIGIINEDTDPDAEIGLKKNMAGLRDILKSLGYKKAAKTYN